MNSAIFLDRDGVINELAYNPDTGEYEAPHSPGDFHMFSYVVEALKGLTHGQYLLFLISNQPDYAKGKTSMENLLAIQEKMHKIFLDNGIIFSQYYYCYHHPDGIVPEYTKVCECRKPNVYFIEKAELDYNLDLSRSWLIGDQDTDILAGKKCGMKTILLNNIHSVNRRGGIEPDFRVADLQDAINRIKNSQI